jgi:hypothetical protein
MRGPHSSFGPGTRQVCAVADRRASASCAAALGGWAASETARAGGPPRVHPRPSGRHGPQSRLLSNLDVSGDRHPDGHVPVDRVLLGVQRAAAGVEADLAAEVACQLAGQPAAVYLRLHGLGGAGCHVPAWLGGRGHHRAPGRLHSLYARRRGQTGVQRPAECRRIPVPPPSDRVAGPLGATVQWDAETTRLIPGELLVGRRCWAWRSGTPGSSGWSRPTAASGWT